MSDQPPSTPVDQLRCDTLSRGSVARTRHIEPQRAVIADQTTSELRTDSTWIVLDRGRKRELVLRVGRGVVRDIEPREEG